MKRNMSFSDIEVALKALHSQIKRIGKKVGLVVCGGTALNALGLVQRTTADIDVVGFAEKSRIRLSSVGPNSRLGF